MRKFLCGLLVVSLGLFGCSSATSNKGENNSASEDTNSVIQDSLKTMLRTQKIDSSIYVNLSGIISNLIAGNAREAAVAFSYPIERPYPLESIEDSSDFVKYFKEIITEDVAMQLMDVQKQGWTKLKGIGWSCCNGEICSKNGESITTFNLLAKKTQIERDSLKNEEIQSLEASLQKGWNPYQTYYCKKNKMIARVDVSNGESGAMPYRIAIYDRQSDLKLQPTALMYGTMDLQGEASNKYFQFSDNLGNSAELYIDSNDPTLYVLTTVINDSAASVTVTKDFWLKHLK